jgi:hypothetical protein
VALKIWRLLTILLAALSLTMESAHLLEMPQKMQYGPELYSSVNTTMYKYFAYVGGVWQTGSIAAALILVYLVRKRRESFRWALAGAVLLVFSFVTWLAVVAPVNGQIAEAMRSAPGSVPELWMELRDRWEYGHAAGFVLQLPGLAAVVWSVVTETPER